MAKTPPTLLFDVSNLYHRTVHGLSRRLAPGEEQWDALQFAFAQAVETVERAHRNAHVVLAADTPPYWRTSGYPFYKYGRADARARDPLNWDALHRFLDEQLLPRLSARWPCIRVPGAEADDVIAVLVRRLTPDPVLILSSDRDLFQLQTLRGVEQSDPGSSRRLRSEDPAAELAVKILTGDDGDRVGNVLMDDQACQDWATGRIRKPAFGEAAARKVLGAGLDAWLNATGHRANWERNSRLLDLGRIPRPIADAIERAWHPHDANPGRATTAPEPPPRQMALL